MWDLRIANPFGRLSIRNMLVFVAATIVTALAFILLTAPATHAADATWNGDSISYGSNQYQKIADAKNGDGLGLPEGSHVYAYITPHDDSLGANAPLQKANIIYFAPSDDPTHAKSANYEVFDFKPPATYTNPTGQKTLSLEDKAADDSGTSCSIPGIGWIICPISNFLATSMDWLFTHVLAQFLAVEPVQSNTDNALFNAWAVMRNFANVAFVMAFLVIIYSQVSNIGITNYGIKKMLPRLVVAAVLVNISYWICAIAIDVSNILGYSLNDLLMNITKSVQNAGSNTTQVMTWQNITTALVSGGTVAVAGATALIAVGSMSGAIALLLPVLLGVLIAALVAIIIMAARQAIVVILVIVAPLAFVAYLLPNTEKYFEKWKDLFITMLMLFPIFSVLFGGSQLAGTAIIQNADSIIMLILGMAVQVAPLVILPFMIKFSGSLLGRIAGMTNDRTKGLLDRSKGRAQDYANAKKAKTLARPGVRRRNVLAHAVQGADTKRRAREDQQKVDEAVADNRWHGSQAHARIDRASREAERTKQTLEQHHNAEWDNHARTNLSSREQERRLRVASDQANLAKTQLDGMYEDYKAQDLSKATSALQQDAIITSQNLAVAGMRQEAAKRKQVSDVSHALLNNDREIDGQKILTYAGGVEGTIGEESALSKAVAAHRKQFGENVTNNLELMKHFNIKTSDKMSLAMGRNLEAKKDGVTFVFKADNAQAREAAHEEILTKGSYAEVERLLASTGTYINEAGVEVGLANHEYAGSLGRSAAEKKIPTRALYWGSRVLDDIGQGKINGQVGINRSIVHHLEEGKVKTDALSGMDATALARTFKIAQNPSAYAEIARDGDPTDLIKNSRALRKMAQDVLDNPLLLRNASKKAEEVMRTFVSGQPVLVDDLKIEDLKAPPTTPES